MTRRSIMEPKPLSTAALQHRLRRDVRRSCRIWSAARLRSASVTPPSTLERHQPLHVQCDRALRMAACSLIDLRGDRRVPSPVAAPVRGGCYRHPYNVGGEGGCGLQAARSHPSGAGAGLCEARRHGVRRRRSSARRVTRHVAQRAGSVAGHESGSGSGCALVVLRAACRAAGARHCDRRRRPRASAAWLANSSSARCSLGVMIFRAPRSLCFLFRVSITNMTAQTMVRRCQGAEPAPPIVNRRDRIQAPAVCIGIGERPPSLRARHCVRRDPWTLRSAKAHRRGSRAARPP